MQRLNQQQEIKHPLAWVLDSLIKPTIIKILPLSTLCKQRLTNRQTRNCLTLMVALQLRQMLRVKSPIQEQR